MAVKARGSDAVVVAVDRWFASSGPQTCCGLRNGKPVASGLEAVGLWFCCGAERNGAGKRECPPISMAVLTGGSGALARSPNALRGTAGTKLCAV
jgi:hypothetical protein